MKAIFKKTSLGFLLGALCMASTAAWAQPRISVHPLMVEKGPRGERWNSLFMREVADQKIAMTPEADVEAFLEKHGGSCKNEIKCLTGLGYATQAHYILVGSMLRAENVYTVHARVVMVDNTEVKKVSVDMERVSKISEEANATAIYKKLFAELKLESLPSHPPVSLMPPEIIIEKGETEFVDREVVPLPGRGFQSKDELIRQLSEKPSPMRTTSYTLLGVSGATAVTGTVFALLANSNHSSFKKNYALGDDTRAIRTGASTVEAKKLMDKVSTQKTISIVSFSVAAAAAATGITLFFISPERYVKDAKVQVGLVPTQGGAVLSLQGVFP